MGGPTLRRPTTADLDAILALSNDATSLHRRTECQHRDSPELASQLYDRLAEDVNLVLEQAGEMLAFASWQYFGQHAHLNVLAVAGGQQRRGLGRRIFEAFLEELRDDQIASFSLRVFTDSPWAHAFYVAQGLQPLTGQVADLPPGFTRYLVASTAQGDWPCPEKTMYFSALG